MQTLLWIRGFHWLSRQMSRTLICRCQQNCLSPKGSLVQPTLPTLKALDFFLPLHGRHLYQIWYVLLDNFSFLMAFPSLCVFSREKKKQRAAEAALSAWQMIFLNLDLINPVKCYISTIGWKSFPLQWWSPASEFMVSFQKWTIKRDWLSCLSTKPDNSK